MLGNKVAYIQNPSIDKTCTWILKVNGYHQPIKSEKKGFETFFSLLLLVEGGQGD
jgi:hypothetical protein